jgi:protein involved in polysaccharide export with SLBB domain
LGVPKDVPQISAAWLVLDDVPGKFPALVLDDVPAMGLTAAEFRDLLTAKLEEFVSRPEVSVIAYSFRPE